MNIHAKQSECISSFGFSHYSFDSTREYTHFATNTIVCVHISERLTVDSTLATFFAIGVIRFASFKSC